MATELDLKLLLKRGALVAAANWQIVVIQFVAQTTFQALLAVPIMGAVIVVALLLGADLANLLQGSLRETIAAIASALTSESLALLAFAAAFTVVLLGGSVFMFLVKGGTVEVLVAGNAAAGPIECEPITVDSLTSAARFTLARFMAGCGRLFSRYLTLGLLLILAYGASAAGYVGFVVLGYRAAGERAMIVEWTVIAALAAAVLVAWSGVGLIAFVPLVGLAVFPLQIVALLVRGLIFEYIGLTALGAYVTLFRRHAAQP